MRKNLSGISDLSCSQSFQARLHGAILTPLVMEARSAVHQGGDGGSLGFYLLFKIVGSLSSPLGARGHQCGSDGRRGRGQASSHRSLRRSTHSKQRLALAGHFWLPIYSGASRRARGQRRITDPRSSSSIWVTQEPCQSTCTTSHSRGDEEASSAANCASLTTETSPPASALFG